MNLEEHKKNLIFIMNSAECNTFNKFIALLEIKKQEIINQLLKGESE